VQPLVTNWFSENGTENVAANTMAAMETLDINAQSLTDASLPMRWAPD
jgi:hypothetical protein